MSNDLKRDRKKNVYKYIAVCQRRATVLYSHSWIQNRMMIFLSMTWIGFSEAVNSFLMIMFLFMYQFHCSFLFQFSSSFMLPFVIFQSKILVSDMLHFYFYILHFVFFMNTDLILLCIA